MAFRESNAEDLEGSEEHGICCDLGGVGSGQVALKGLAGQRAEGKLRSRMRVSGAPVPGREPAGDPGVRLSLEEQQVLQGDGVWT